VGFGIRDGETARRVGKVADAVVIGSRIVQDLTTVPVEQAPAKAKSILDEFSLSLGPVTA
jgi:tryptophan synthase alpha chain